MLSIIIQPKNWNPKTIDDIERITIIKFSHKSLYENDVSYITMFDGNDYNKDLVLNIVKNLKNENVLTYNGKLLKSTMEILSKYYGIDEDYRENVIPLMELYAELHNNNRWAKLQDALNFYDINESVDIYDPFNMAKNTFLLYRKMEGEI